MIQPKRYNRSNTTKTVSEFYEQFLLNKYNFEPSYQRKGGIWKEKNQAFLIDTIFKNFPMPPIFLEQKIYNGRTSYDVIDGKQRLTSIIKFINDEIKLPSNFSEDDYGYKPLNGKKLSEIIELAKTDKIAEGFIDIFWSYKISIEYIEKPDTNIVKGIFDRLNRYGERLNPAELRKAKYSDTLIFNAIEDVSKTTIAKNAFDFSEDKRQRGLNFWTEVFIFVDENGICGGSAGLIDKHMEKFIKYDDSQVGVLKQEVCMVIDLFNSWSIDKNRFDLAKETHLYVLMYLASYILQNKIKCDNLSERINDFYEKLRSCDIETSADQNLVSYYNSTQSGVKTSKSRQTRFESLLKGIGMAK